MSSATWLEHCSTSLADALNVGASRDPADQNVELILSIHLFSPWPSLPLPGVSWWNTFLLFLIHWHLVKDLGDWQNFWQPVKKQHWLNLIWGEVRTLENNLVKHTERMCQKGWRRVILLWVVYFLVSTQVWPSEVDFDIFESHWNNFLAESPKMRQRPPPRRDLTIVSIVPTAFAWGILMPFWIWGFNRTKSTGQKNWAVQDLPTEFSSHLTWTHTHMCHVSCVAHTHV